MHHSHSDQITLIRKKLLPSKLGQEYTTLVIPLAILITLSVLIYKELKKANIERGGEEEVEKLRQTEHRMAKIGFVIAVFFLICQTGYSIMNIVEALHINSIWFGTSKTLRSITFLLLAINSSGNFMIYFLHSGCVRKKLVRFFCVKGENETNTNQLVEGEDERTMHAGATHII